MSLFQLYETQRKHFNVGKKWICVDPGSVGFAGDTKDEIIEIIENKETFSRYEVLRGFYKSRDFCRYKVLRGIYKSREYQTPKTDILKAYEPYLMETTSNA
jgi:hypothetical protein